MCEGSEGICCNINKLEYKFRLFLYLSLVQNGCNINKLEYKYFLQAGRKVYLIWL